MRLLFWGYGDGEGAAWLVYGTLESALRHEEVEGLGLASRVLELNAHLSTMALVLFLFPEFACGIYVFSPHFRGLLMLSRFFSSSYALL